MSEIIKKAKISKDNLPPISSISGEYSIRYRVISDDKNRTSSWSQIFSVNPDYTYVSGKINIAASSGVVRVSWDPVIIKIEESVISQAKDYDIYTRWSKTNNLGDWNYVERISSNSTSFVIPDTFFINGVDQEHVPNRITIEIYLKGEPITREYSALRVYSPAMHTV